MGFAHFYTNYTPQFLRVIQALANFKDEKYCMIFRLDEKFIRRTRLEIAVIGIALIAVGVAFLYAMVIEKNWKLLFGVFSYISDLGRLKS